MSSTPVDEIMPPLREALLLNGRDEAQWVAEGYEDQGAETAAYLYDAMWAIALAIKEANSTMQYLLTAKCDTNVNCFGDKLLDIIKSQKFTGATGTVEFAKDEEGLATGDRASHTLPFPVRYWNSTSSSWRTAGYYRQGGRGEEVLELMEPIVWSHLSTEIPPDGGSCPTGMYFDDNAIGCLPCGMGRFSAVRGQANCSACDPGYACPLEKCTTCDSCDTGTYQDIPGQTSCKPCPPNTRTAERATTSVTGCVCKEGFFRIDGQPGKECYPCPDGGVCPGGSHQPYPSNGYWGNWSLIDGSVKDSREYAEYVKRTAFHHCPYSAFCTSSCAPTGTEEPSNTTTGPDQGTGDACRSNPENVCSEGHKGRLCESCEDGYFVLGSKCFKCLKPEGLFVGGATFAIICIWYLLNRVAAGNYEAVDLMLIYFQNASTITAFSLNWHPSLVEYPFWALAIVNFDVTYISPQCTWSSWSYGHGLILQKMLPIIVMSIYLILYLVNKAVIEAFGRRDSDTLSMMSVAEDDGGKHVGGVLAAVLRKLGQATSHEELHQLGDTYIAGSASFLNVVYHTMTLKSFEAFFCKELLDGTEYLVAGPSVLCWQGPHWGYLALSSFGLIIYTAGVPTLFFMILRYGKIHNLFRNSRFMRQWGWLYLRYEKEWYFWEVVIMIRRGLLVVVLVTCRTVPSIQLVAGIALVTCLITSHFYARPFISVSLDYLDTFSLVSLMGLLCTGSLFYAEDGRAMFSNWDTTVMAICIANLFGCMVMVIIMVFRDVTYEEAIKSIDRRLRRIFAYTISPVNNDSPGALKEKRLSLLTSLAFNSPAAGGQEGNRLAKMVKNEEMELSKTLDAANLDKWLKVKTETVEDRRASRLLSERLSRTSGKNLSPKRFASMLSHKAYSLQLQQSVVRFWLCNHWTRNVLSDTSPVSYYSQRPYAIFYGNLVSENPYLIDYMLHAPPEKLKLAKRVINQMRHAQMTYTKGGRLAKMISPIDRGPLLAWLMVAKDDNISTIRDLLVDIYKANHCGADPAELQSAVDERNFVVHAFDWFVQRLPPPDRLGLQQNLTVEEEQSQHESVTMQARISASASRGNRPPGLPKIHSLVGLLMRTNTKSSGSAEIAATSVTGAEDRALPVVHAWGEDSAEPSMQPERPRLDETDPEPPGADVGDADCSVVEIDEGCMEQSSERQLLHSPEIPTSQGTSATGQRWLPFGIQTAGSVAGSGSRGKTAGEGSTGASSAPDQRAKWAAQVLTKQLKTFRELSLGQFDAEIRRLSNEKSALTSELKKLEKSLAG
mmetsp:Transcript_31463/g.74760  ORF Transcript_31463/g.74760 Transcript_31463/m.74760 type:complete len:1288 (-) Transcript_31463:217-4080(-)